MCVKSVKNYNDCMLRKVEEIAQVLFRLRFSDLPKLVQRIIEDEASVVCSYNLVDSSPHVWRNKIY